MPLNPPVILISPDPVQQLAWRDALAPVVTSDFASLSLARDVLDSGAVFVVALHDPEQIPTLLLRQQQHSAGVAVVAADRASLAATALDEGVDCLLASDPLFNAALRQRVTSEIASLEAREALAAANAQFQRAHREVTLAAQTQSRFRPASPLVSGSIVASHRVIAAGQLSGDCVDYFRLADGRFVFYVADVAGHGLSAALLTPLLKSFSLQLARGLAHASLPELLSIFGADIAALNCGKHVAIFAGVISADETTLRYCSAGHAPPPMLESNGRMRMLSAVGKPLGLFPDARYAEEVIALPVAFTLAAFSDGVLDLVPGADLAERHAALAGLLSATAGDLDALAERLGLIPGREFRDDVECLLLSRSARS